MIFTSITFLVFFAILACLLVVIRTTDNRQTLLLVASYVFYGAWNSTYLLLIFFSSLWGWLLGLMMTRAKSEPEKKLYLAISLALSLGMLGYYKYADFIVDNIYLALGNPRTTSFDILLPVGISFFTFQTMSYTIDLYRGNIAACYSLKKFMLFVAFFPQLVAGPIVRASDFLPQLDKKIVFKREDILIGFQIFLGGAIQKVLFADNLSRFVDPVFGDPGLYSSTTLWLALISYAVQIFCDFCGYSLMAIGIARALGFKLPPNFNMPYISLSVTEFWRRWHLSLSFWLRDYLYISLGGNRHGSFRTYQNLIITMLLGGLWHGASWNFVVWGVGHGIALAVHKFWSELTDHWRIKRAFVYKLFTWALTFLVAILLWIPFRTADITVTKLYFSRLWCAGNGFDWISSASIVVLGLAIAWHIAFIMKSKYLFCFPMTKPFGWYGVGCITGSLMLFVLVAPLDASPFIYFQF